MTAGRASARALVLRAGTGEVFTASRVAKAADVGHHTALAVLRVLASEGEVMQMESNTPSGAPAAFLRLSGKGLL